MSGDDVRAEERGRRDDGATLLELLICIVVMSVIATVLLAVVATFMRNDASASARIDETRDLQQISSYLPGDMSSAFLTELEVDANSNGIKDAVDPATAAACPGVTDTVNNVLQLKWSESFGGSNKQYRAEYRTRVSGDDTQIVRITCSGSTLGGTKTHVVARELRATNPVTSDVSYGAGVVKLTLHQKSGRTLTITVTTQNPHAELEETSDYED
jgi:type II secretory pathway component PulJ